MIAAALAVLFLSAAAAEAPIVVTGRATGRRPVPDVVLATMRGGLRLPNGLDVAVGIDIQTRIDGVLALHTIYSSQGPDAGIRVYTDGTDAARSASGTTMIDQPGQTATPVVIAARLPSGTVVTPGTAIAPVAVNLVTGAPDTWLNANGQTQLAVAVDGPAVVAAPGTVRLASNTGGATVTLDAPMLQVQHLIGQATGVIVANAASDRTIDSVSAINVDLGGVNVAAMSALFALQRTALDAVRGR